jgi:Fur family iron response transcriptional regulator
MSHTSIPKPSRLETAKAKELLETYGITPTPQRIQIASVLLALPQHLTADQLLKLVNDERVTVSKATVYNSLRLFARKGLVREVVVDPGRVFYDSNTSPHYHLYNVSTGLLVDIDESQIILQRLPQLPRGTVVESVDVVLRLRDESCE